jgi:vesicle-fusing ATPase
VPISVLPSPPHPAAPLFLQSIDIEVGFFRPNQARAEEFSVDDMSKIFLTAFSGIIMAVGESIAFEYRGVPLKGTVVSLSVLQLADEQRSSHRGGSGGSRKDSGILMEKTDVNFLKASDSPIRLKSSAKKFVLGIFVLSISVTNVNHSGHLQMLS